VAAFHALPKSKQPEIEIKFIKFIPEKYPQKTILFSGDFNCPQSHNVFLPLKEQGYKPIFTRQKTTLKTEPKGEESLASEYDNVFYDTTKVQVIKPGVIHFYKSFPTLKDARKISDHLPVYCEIKIK
jgi:endonuclease/exonuclease/phosphatase family metal-dependent hydrolase